MAVETSGDQERAGAAAIARTSDALPVLMVARDEGGQRDRNADGFLCE